MKKATKESIKIAGYISRFLNEYAPTQKTNSSNTLRSYQNALSLFLLFLENEKKIRCETLDNSCFRGPVIEEWLGWLAQKRMCSPASCNNRLASLRAFLKYLGSREPGYLCLFQEASAIVRRKSIRKKVEGLSRNAVKTLMRTPNPATKTGRRDIALIVLLYCTAARINEILSMKNRQLHLEGPNPYATVIGKGGKVRSLPLLPKAVAHLKHYVKEFHGEEPAPDAFVFYSRNTGRFGKLTQPAIDKMLKKHAKIAHSVCPEVPLDLHAHRLRHAKASHWLEDGINIVQISFLLGHEQLQTTMVYLDITTEEKAKSLATLEDENDKKVSPKWKNTKGGSLIDFCGIRRK